MWSWARGCQHGIEQGCTSYLMIGIMCLYLRCQDFYRIVFSEVKLENFRNGKKPRAGFILEREDFSRDLKSWCRGYVFPGGWVCSQPCLPWSRKGRQSGDQITRGCGGSPASPGIFPKPPLPGICSVFVTTHIFSSKSLLPKLNCCQRNGELPTKWILKELEFLKHSHPRASQTFRFHGLLLQ